MENILMTLQSGAAQGLWWAILTIGVFITFRLLDFADLSVEGTFPLGAAITAVLINAGVNPGVAIVCAFVAGCLAGMCTGILNVVCKIPPILAGILTMIALYSINIRIMSDKSSLSIDHPTLKTHISGLLSGMDLYTVSILTGLAFCTVIIVILYMFFGTEIGCAIRATGHNKHMAKALGVNTGLMTVLALMISNGLVAMSGSLIAQFDLGSAIVTMGQGAIVIGLASVIIGEVIFCHKDHGFAYVLTAVVIGAVIYRVIISLALSFNFFKASDLKVITAIIVALALSIPVIKNAINKSRNRRSNSKMFAQMAAEEANTNA